jgi:hypothetical protein
VVTEPFLDDSLLRELSEVIGGERRIFPRDEKTPSRLGFAAIDRMRKDSPQPQPCLFADDIIRALDLLVDRGRQQSLPKWCRRRRLVDGCD